MNKRIVHIIIGLNVGGAELMLKRLVLHSQEKEEFQHSVISLTDNGVIGAELKSKGIPVYSLGMQSTLSIPSILFELRKLLRELQPDVVQTWMYHADFLGGLAAKSLGINNIIWGIRTTDVSQGASKLTVHLSKLCAKLSYYIPTTIICAAHVSKDYHIGIGYDESKMVVIPNGFDLEALTATDEDGLEIRRLNNLSVDDVVIGSIGRFNPVKNQKLFVDVAALLVKKHPDLKFMIIGKDNTIENKELMSWINSYEITDNFRLLGQRDDVPRCLKAMDIFCLHSKTEGFPNVLVEALYLRVSCVAADVGDVKGIMNNEDRIVSKGDFEQMASVIERDIQGVFTSQKFINELKDVQVSHIKNKYSIKKVHELYIKTWQL